MVMASAGWWPADGVGAQIRSADGEIDQAPGRGQQRIVEAPRSMMATRWQGVFEVRS